MATEWFAQKQSFHFADVFTEFSQRYATGQFGAIVCEDQASRRWSVIPGKVRQFPFKVLETEVDLEPYLIFAEELSGLIEVLRSLCLKKIHLNAEGVRKFQPRASPWERTIWNRSNSERVRELIKPGVRRNPYRVDLNSVRLPRVAN